MSPTFSIVIPTYPPHYNKVERLIKLIKAQTYPATEIIVAASSFSSIHHAFILKLWKSLGAIVKTTGLPQRAGANRNMGCEIATSEYVVFMDSDDIPHKQKLEATAHVINKYPEAELIVHDYFYYNELRQLSIPIDVESIHITHLNPIMRNLVVYDNEDPTNAYALPIDNLPEGSKIHHGWATFRRSLFGEFKQHPTIWPPCEDSMFCRQLVTANKQAYYINYRLMVYSK